MLLLIFYGQTHAPDPMQTLIFFWLATIPAPVP
jgi:hypothetical protein